MVALRIEDYALIGDCRTGALVGRDGSIDWICLPRFDSASVFGALLGGEDHGRWKVSPADAVEESERRYIDSTFVLSTRWRTASGEVEVLDFMPQGDQRADLVRRVRGISGSVVMPQDLRMRFDYSAAIPWVHQAPSERRNALIAVAGPDALVVRGPHLRAGRQHHVSTFTVEAGTTVNLVMTWFPAHLSPPPPNDVDTQLAETIAWWQGWASRCSPPLHYREQVIRSLLVLRALTHKDTGGIAAAVTTSLPEQFGGSRNWDYRYVWLRDASLTIEALLAHGYAGEVEAWRGWLLRAIAGDPGDVQIM